MGEMIFFRQVSMIPIHDILPHLVAPLKSGEITRFAPSPSGYLHLGHAFSAMFASSLAATSGGVMCLRIDDIDTTRCREIYFDAIFEDLAFLGIPYAEPVRYQSQHLSASHEALEYLKNQDLIYPCYLSRRELAELLSAPHHPSNTDQLITSNIRSEREADGNQPAWRLRMATIRDRFRDIQATDLIHGQVNIVLENIGDEVIARKDIGTSYHLSTVLDDDAMGVSLVSRGYDLFDAIPVQRILQELLGITPPRYAHHELIPNEQGQRLAKRENALSLRQMRQNGCDRDLILRMMTKCRNFIEKK
jgi:glutamyl-Q tRNA(Asp) synthetase